MKRSSIISFYLVAMVWGSGCMHTRTVARPAPEVVGIVQSLAPDCETEEKIAGREWLVTIKEGIEREKFKHHEILFDILAHKPTRTRVTIRAELVYPFDHRVRAYGVARRYAKKLRLALKVVPSEQAASPNGANRAVGAP